ncbi:hypothetical protein PLESTB_001747200 [Pleodorina starrii]|uniref:Uncharacterized protein n=1 Tax=Pleodorina starrii TaxID=330485 RepID=A0A9W6BZY5_9CHLO|nr:hypothetical protein PLESTB_001747200 [Pleodorina starrii]GLC69330.1 hypothetical protein PLESTF_000817600 [Pleodorina starrii]
MHLCLAVVIADLLQPILLTGLSIYVALYLSGSELITALLNVAVLVFVATLDNALLKGFLEWQYGEDYRISLAFLDVIYNNPGIGDEGAKILAWALLENDTLPCLSLQRCGIGREGGEALLKALKRNPQALSYCLELGNPYEEAEGANNIPPDLRKRFEHWMAAAGRSVTFPPASGPPAPEPPAPTPEPPAPEPPAPEPPAPEPPESEPPESEQPESEPPESEPPESEPPESEPPESEPPESEPPESEPPDRGGAARVRPVQ